MKGVTVIKQLYKTIDVSVDICLHQICFLIFQHGLKERLEMEREGIDR